MAYEVVKGFKNFKFFSLLKLYIWNGISLTIILIINLISLISNLNSITINYYKYYTTKHSISENVKSTSQNP